MGEPLVTLPAFRDAAEDPALRGAPLAVYAFAVSRLDAESYQPLKHSAIAVTLHMRPQTVGSAFRVLVRRGYLERGDEAGQLATYRLKLERVRKLMASNRP